MNNKLIKENDTICALATPSGEGGIGIIKISGSKSFLILKKIFRNAQNKKINKIKPWCLYYGFIINPLSKEKIDEALVSYMKKPKSYTCEDVVEINIHSGPIIIEKILNLVLSLGVRLAEPGEFTRRAFLGGRIDLLEAEAVCDLIKSRSEASLRQARNQLEGYLSKKINNIKKDLLKIIADLEVNINFSDQDIPEISQKKIKTSLIKIKKEIDRLLKSAFYNRIYREGINIALIGLPNVGKSSLFNAILKEQRAIVTQIPGTTRDIIEENIIIQGILVKLTDTAGLTKDINDKVSQEAIKQSERAIKKADLIILVFDLKNKNTLDNFFYQIKKNLKKEIINKPIIIVGNKKDLIKNSKPQIQIPKSMTNKNNDIVLISAKTGQGIKKLEQKIKNLIFKGKAKNEPTLVINLRHQKLLKELLTKIEKVLENIKNNFFDELIIIDLNEALNSLLEITGEGLIREEEEVLNKIFENFCIGK